MTVLNSFDGYKSGVQLYGDVSSAFLNSLRRFLEERRPKDKEEPRPDHGPKPPSSRIYVWHRQDDRAFARKVRGWLRQHDAEALSPGSDEDPDRNTLHTRNLRDCDAVFLCWADATDVWALNSARELRNWQNLGRKEAFSVRGLVLGPPPGESKCEEDLPSIPHEIDECLDLSKDAVLEASFASGSVPGRIAFVLGAFAALLTSFYSWRLIFLTFFGDARWAASEHVQHAVHSEHETPDKEHGDSSHDTGLPPAGTAGYHPHESPWTMLVPIVLLAVGAVAAGQIFHHTFLESAEFWNGSVSFDEHLADAMHEVPLWVKYTATAVMLVGLAIAWNNYIRRPDAAAGFVRQFPGLHRFVLNKWYFDELFDILFVRPSLWLGRLFWKGGDEGTIDRFGPHGAAYAVGVGNRLTARLQSGYLYSYALVMLLGLIGAATWAIWWAGR